VAEHPIQAPQELAQEWFAEALYQPPELRPRIIATRAAQWGADQELEACCEWVQGYAECGDSLRAARRPKPPSLKEQALEALAAIEGDFNTVGDRANTIRRAIEALPDE
jgi:hypothetical protein